MMALVVNSWCTSARRTGWISRALVRDLGGRLKARVELRQIGPRDETRLQGGIGPCGRGVCCATFLKDFEPVSVRMPKTQPT
jgi:cell fate regulator YaaT (PSP1 superfamily)